MKGTEKGDKLTTTLNPESKFEEKRIRVCWGRWKLCGCHLEVWGGAKARGGVIGLGWDPKVPELAEQPGSLVLGGALAQGTSELQGGPPSGPRKPRSPAAEAPNPVLL